MPPPNPMTPERWHRVKACLAAALDVDSAERAAYLDRTCAGDPALRVEVEQLLASERAASESEFLAEPAIAAPNRAPLLDSDLWIGRRVGAYEIVERIGAGGLGDVYRAVPAA